MWWIVDLLASLRGDDFPAAVVALITLVMIVIAAWALLIGALASSPRLRRVAIAITPRILRTMVFAGVAGALTVPAARADEDGVDGLRLPDRPNVAETTRHSTHEARQTVVVRPGDTLWALARDRSDGRTSAASTVREVQRWYHANRDVIGDNPDLIRPGQRLTAPSEERP